MIKKGPTKFRNRFKDFLISSNLELMRFAHFEKMVKEYQKNNNHSELKYYLKEMGEIIKKVDFMEASFMKEHGENFRKMEKYLKEKESKDNVN